MKGKEEILNQVYEFFINSKDYNGISYEQLDSNFDGNIVSFIIELILDDSVEIITSSIDSNPHIIRSRFKSKEWQVNFLENHDGNQSFCIYPSTSYLKENRDVSEFKDKPFNRMLALGCSQLTDCYFNIEILEYYFNDPRIDSQFIDYSGSIHSNEKISREKFISLDSFGIGRNGEDIVIVSYPRYLKAMSQLNQQIWYENMISNTTSCKTLQSYKDNVFGGNWTFPISVYTAICYEISNLNQLTNHIWDVSLFQKTYQKSDLLSFNMLFFPTTKKYYEFVLDLEKITVSNLNSNFFDKMGLKKIDEKGKVKGTIVRLNEWLTHVNKEAAEKIISSLKKVRKERQIPAHKVYGNDFSKEYLLKQYSLSVEIYDSLNLLRRLIQTNPYSRDFKIPYQDTSYLEIQIKNLLSISN